MIVVTECRLMGSSCPMEAKAQELKAGLVALGLVNGREQEEMVLSAARDIFSCSSCRHAAKEDDGLARRHPSRHPIRSNRAENAVLDLLIKKAIELGKTSK